VNAPVHLATRPAPPRRGPLRRLLEVRGLVGGHTAPHVTVRLLAPDGIPLAGSYLPSRGGAVAVLLLHGFAAHRRKPAYARLADGIARRLPVLALDLRGHGASGGWSTFGDHEAQDVAAGVACLQRLGHRRVVVVGLSMGATAAIHAASTGIEVVGLVAVSAPAWFRSVPETDATRRLKRVWDSPAQRTALRVGLGVRLAGPQRWGRPPHPVEMLARVRSPVLVVHGEDDAYFPVTDAEELTAAAGGTATLWREPAGFGHAEDGLSDGFIRALGDAVVVGARDARFPLRP
jgi:uncharacterized protein